MSAPVDVLAVMDAYSVPGQICCGMPVGGGYDENGNCEPPSCCGIPFTESDMQDARAAVAELIEQRDTLLNALKQALPHVEHAYHTHEDLGGSFWIDVVGCRNALARAQVVQS